MHSMDDLLAMDQPSNQLPEPTTAMHCKLCAKRSGKLLQFCTNCAQDYYVHALCAEQACDAGGALACGGECPARYQLVYSTGDSRPRRALLSTFARCPPAPDSGSFRNCIVFKPVLLLMSSCIASLLFFFCAQSYEELKLVSELLHTFSVICTVAATFLFDRSVAGYIAIYQRIGRVRSQVAAEFVLLLLVMALSALAVKVAPGVLRVDAIFGGWVFATSVVVVPALAIYLLTTRALIYARVSSVEVQLVRIFE